MAKESGLAWSTFSVDDSGGTLRDIRNDTRSLEISTPRAVDVTTGIDKSAEERLLLLADMSVTANGKFNDATNASHDVFKTATSTSVAREISLAHSGQTLGTTPQVTLLITDYSLSRGDDGALDWKVPMVLANGEVPTWT